MHNSLRVEFNDGPDGAYDVEVQTVTGQDDEPTTAYAACIFDGARGHEQVSRLIIDLAKAHGFAPNDPTVNLDDLDMLVDTTDGAIGFLNDAIVQPEPDVRLFGFGMSDGDFMLACSAWWEAE